MTGEQDRLPLTDSPLFKRIAGFNKFETSARAFVDVAAFVKMGGKRNKEVAKLLDDLGLNGLRSLVMYSGFEGRAERGLIEWDMPGPRKGLLTLLTGKPFKLGDVPPLPPDVVSWTMTNFDAAAFYDTAYRAAEQIVGLVSPDDVPKIKEFTKQANDLLGVDLRKDLLGSLGDQFAYYTSPGDGPFTLGQTVLFKVKDADKLQATLEQIIKSLGNGVRQAGAHQEARLSRRGHPRGLRASSRASSSCRLTPSTRIGSSSASIRRRCRRSSSVARANWRSGSRRRWCANRSTSCPRSSSPSPTAIRGRR